MYKITAPAPIVTVVFLIAFWDDSSIGGINGLYLYWLKGIIGKILGATNLGVCREGSPGLSCLPVSGSYAPS